ncbi:MAG: hypothetical protein KME20_16500 [Kaiparowitsia implicata GSE-PSE-MK54-09C]|nr:hypothetical protein [Kaiparowitsia implicata GSE-PSE-MK54-09C]
MMSGSLVLQSGTFGLISGGILGLLFGLCFFSAALWTGAVGAGLGLALGLVNGLFLSVITGLFFFPLLHIRLYQATAIVMSALISGAGTASFGPWYFAEKVMTPSSAVFIGFNSVMASLIAGLAGALIGQYIAQWYEQTWMRESQVPPGQRIPFGVIAPNPRHHLRQAFCAQRRVWLGVSVLALLSPLVGNWLLRRLVCGTQDVITCLPSPRLYTSVIAGFKASSPAVVIILLIVAFRKWRANC